MDQKIFKVTAWNIEWMNKLLTGLKSTETSESHKKTLKQRLDGIYKAIEEIAPDILCITEGPTIKHIDYFLSGLPDYRVLKRPVGEPYLLKGQQWIWFLVRKELELVSKLQSNKVWRDYTESASPDGEHKATWPVCFWGEMHASMHAHYRHPQVLITELAGCKVELIGGHFKSLLTNKGNYHSTDETSKKIYVDLTLKNRVKLATEAQNVRYYIDKRFKQEVNPAIIVLGDLNDGPGKELFERQYLFFDLMTNLQGDVFEAKKYLNHALFDYPQHLRWTARFVDKIDKNRDPHILIDHIMFTQSLVDGSLPLRINSGAGKVEHEIFDRINALLPSKYKLSDHKPISCILHIRPEHIIQ